MKAEVIDITTGQPTGESIELNDAVFAGPVRKHLLWRDVKRILNNRRQGTHKTKERGEVAYSTRKLFAQKGRGMARRGSRKAPPLRGAGTIFGPRPRSYEEKINKKEKRAARRSALAALMQQGRIIVVDDFTMDTPKTKAFLKMWKNLELPTRKAALVKDDTDPNLIAAGRNVPNVAFHRADCLNTYRILHAGTLVITRKAAQFMNENF